VTDDAYLSLGLESRDRVNQQFGGGIPSGSIVLLSGPDGTGKSCLTQRFTYGFCDEGYDTTYISTELDSKGFLEQMYSISYDVTDHLLQDRLLFLNADIDTHRVDGEATGVRDLLPKFSESPGMWESDVIVIDEFAAMLRNDPGFDQSTEYGDEDHAMQSLLNFFRKITSRGKVLILTVSPDGLSDRGLRPLQEAADLYFDIETEQVGSNVQHSMTVKRFSEMKQPVDDTIGFAVEQGRGIVIQSRTVA